jgi:magnesium-protoporphyrin O-methyltransferase
MATATYDIRRGELTTYFDRTAADAWEALTSDAPVSKIRATVRAGRDRMRALLLSRLPADMNGLTLLDAGCGTGALAIEAARRGAKVTAIDVSPRMIAIANERLGNVALAGDITFLAGDMLDPVLGSFDHVVAMDSLIHYVQGDVLRALGNLAARTRRSILFTIAPRTPLLSAMHTAGKVFPRGDRSPAIEPIAPARLARGIAHDRGLAGWRLATSERVSSGFYMSQAQELVRR